MPTNDKTLREIIDSLNDSIDDIHNHPTEIDRVPSTLEIMVSGVTDSKAIEVLFSPNIDKLINSMFAQIEKGEFDKILENKESMEKLLDSIFGKGSFKGPVSNLILKNVDATVQSKKFQDMKTNMKGVLKVLKQKNLIIKNLTIGKKNLKDNTEIYKKYSDAIYAIKKVLKFAERVYRNRKIINRKVYNGLNNIVHEDYFDQTLC